MNTQVFITLQVQQARIARAKARKLESIGARHAAGFQYSEARHHMSKARAMQSATNWGIL